MHGGAATATPGPDPDPAPAPAPLRLRVTGAPTAVIISRVDTPEDLRFTREHEWARDEGGGLIRVGITDYAQDALGDVVYVDVPEPGTEVHAGQPFGEVESTKSVSDVFSPVTGVVRERNPALVDTAELVNQAPYGDGWIAVIEASDPAEFGTLLEAPAYREYVEGLSED
jgi:glycine cleavage system H protein